MALFETVTDLKSGAEVLRRRPYGVIEFVDGRLRHIRLRPFPRLITGPEVLLVGGTIHRHLSSDRLWLYYNQPRRCPNFLVLKYVVSTRGSSFRSLSRAMEAFDEIARLKRSDALLCDVSNWRVSNRLMTRWGWTPHCPSRWHRHYIKRRYPKVTAPDWAAWSRFCEKVSGWANEWEPITTPSPEAELVGSATP